MSNKHKPILDVEFDTKVLEHLVVELSIIVSDNGIEKSKSINNRLLKEVLDLTLDDMYQGFCFYPFGKVVDGNNEKFSLIGY